MSDKMSEKEKVPGMRTLTSSRDFGPPFVVQLETAVKLGPTQVDKDGRTRVLHSGGQRAQNPTSTEKARNNTEFCFG